MSRRCFIPFRSNNIQPIVREEQQQQQQAKVGYGLADKVEHKLSKLSIKPIKNDFEKKTKRKNIVMNI